MWPSTRSIGAYSRLRAFGFGSFQSISQQISQSSRLTISRSRVNQRSTTTQHPTTDTHCGTLGIWAPGLWSCGALGIQSCGASGLRRISHLHTPEPRCYRTFESYSFHSLTKNYSIVSSIWISQLVPHTIVIIRASPPILKRRSPWRNIKNRHVAHCWPLTKFRGSLVMLDLVLGLRQAVKGRA
jgi:hypothetical protein